MSVALPVEQSPAYATPSQERISAREHLARVRLARSQNVGPRTFHHMLRRFGTAERAVEALPELAARGGKRDYTVCPRDQAEEELETGDRLGCQLLLAGEPEFPDLLGQVEPVPPLIWCRGRTDLLRESAVALVGARNASALGLRTARRLARELGVNGHVVVSGMARGVDAAAHDAAMATGTIAVLAGGLDMPYPAENEQLHQRLADEGALISEVPFGVEPTSRHFPRRNRLISGLSRGVVLIEAAARSGSLITARFALEQGREVMACPGAAEDPRAAGCNAMIRDGAALVRHAGDVDEALAAPRTIGLAEGGREFEFDADMFGEDTMRDDYDALADFDEEGGMGDEALADQIVGLLGPQPVEIDDIARECGVSASELSLAILELDLAGRISIQPGGMIALNME
ncbi:MAG: DNA-processing protein DprA [Pseudomonadota bacterium]